MHNVYIEKYAYRGILYIRFKGGILMQKERIINLDKIAERRIAVEILNGCQEKELRMICHRLGEEIVRKDDTAYRVSNERKEPVYPIYYAFFKYGEKRGTWWTNDLKVVNAQGYLRIGFDSFKEIIGGNLWEKV